ncbi:MAG: fatty acid desaturase [Bacteroidales bacterium]|nr:fatty acid desaturase [Bacteroidales bacterium]MCF8457158.1 fatty acid desaturase [Bacteroidales bacterium]
MGILIAISILSAWIIHLFYCLMNVEIAWANPWIYLHILIQTHLFTGLFITAHDAMHQSISKSVKMNRVFGYLAAFLFAGMNYKKLKPKHFDHHRYPGSDSDPDFHTSNRFFRWWFEFMKQYISFWQILIMAGLFNLLMIWYNESQLLLLWVLPSVLSTFQLFYFGTYLPHRQPHNLLHPIHRSRTQKKNHFWAFLSCYFFGYHLEHHQFPGTPWWKLYLKKVELKIPNHD